jgi:hypothetical protein
MYLCCINAATDVSDVINTKNGIASKREKTENKQIERESCLDFLEQMSAWRRQGKAEERRSGV